MESPQSDGPVTDIEDSYHCGLRQNAQVVRDTYPKADTQSWTSSHFTDGDILESIPFSSEPKPDIIEDSCYGPMTDTKSRVAEQRSCCPSPARYHQYGPRPDDKAAHAHNCEHTLGQYERASGDLSIQPLWPTDIKLLVAIVYDLNDVDRLHQSASAWGLCYLSERNPSLSNILVRPLGARNWLITASAAEVCCEGSILQYQNPATSVADYSGYFGEQRLFSGQQDQSKPKGNSSYVRLEANQDGSKTCDRGSARTSHRPNVRSVAIHNDESINNEHSSRRRSRRKWSGADDEKLVKLVTSKASWEKIFRKFPSRS